MSECTLNATACSRNALLKNCIRAFNSSEKLTLLLPLGSEGGVSRSWVGRLDHALLLLALATYGTSRGRQLTLVHRQVVAGGGRLLRRIRARNHPMIATRLACRCYRITSPGSAHTRYHKDQ